MKILLAAGGTLGHLKPAYVIADELKRKGHIVYFVTLKKNINDKFKDYDNTFYVDIKSLDRKKLYKSEEIDEEAWRDIVEKGFC